MGRRRRSKSARRAPSRGTDLVVSQRSYAGARVARVAVDDATWAAFRTACGPVPASVRLGELVEADVRRARRTEDADARAALREVQVRLEALERLLPPS